MIKKILHKPQKDPEKIKASLILIGSVFVSLILIKMLQTHFEVIEDLMQRHIILTPVASIGMYALLSVTPIPTDPLTLMVGALYGPIWGILIGWMGNNTAALVEYYIGAEIRVATDFEERKAKMPKWLSRFPADSYVFLILGRLIPQFGGKIVSLTGGMYKVPVFKYLWTAAVANLMGSVIYALGGAKLFTLL